MNIIISGEAGVGKTRIAETLHRLSERATHAFVYLDCATSSGRTLERLFEVALDGTLFFDDVGALRLELQHQLAQLLESAGGPPRVIAATERDLRVEVTRGRFRDDLYFRLSGASVRVPPLRERKHEIRSLAVELASQCPDARALPCRFSERAIACLEAYLWPSNVRELRRTVERAVLSSDGKIIEPHHLDIGGLGPLVGSDDEREKIQHALLQTAGNQTKAATLLGISRATLVRRLDEYELPRPRTRKTG